MLSNSKISIYQLAAMKMMQIVMLGVLLTIGAMVSGCQSLPEVDSAPMQVTSRVKEVCDVPLSYRALKNAPAKPVPDEGKLFVSNEQMDLYWKTDVQVAQICEYVCRLRDVLFICTYGQDDVVNAPEQCLGADGELKCD